MSASPSGSVDGVVQIVRARGAALRITPATIDLGTHLGEVGRFRLHPPAGWNAEPTGPRRWKVSPRCVSPDRPARFAVESFPCDGTSGTRRSMITVPVLFDLASEFDPASSALLIRNRASDLGEVRPTRAIFDQTWPHMPERLARLLFEGIYSDVVFLSSGKKRGGLCSGMARWALARGLGEEPASMSTEAAIRRIAVYHGRQMNDLALLGALPWFVRGSPSAAYRAVRRDLLLTGRSDRALDLAVPKLWRKDVVNAVVAEGHTVVPTRLRQAGTREGCLEIYDPNHPEAVIGDEPRTIAFDLKRDRYSYGTLVSMDDSGVGMIAGRQRSYASAGTAILATLGSLVFTPGRGLRSLLGTKAIVRERTDSKTPGLA